MKKTLAVMCVGILALLTIWCEKSETVGAQEENQRVQRLQVTANRVVSGIQYIKDTRTGLCFAYYWGGVGTGMALATVPCEAIPTELLAIAK